MLRKMTDKINGALHSPKRDAFSVQQQQHQLPVAPPTPTDSLATTLSVAHAHRPSISTQRTSLSEAESSKQALHSDYDRDIAMHDANPPFPYPKRDKGRYNYADFDFLRTLGTGSFGRVHLGMSGISDSWAILIVRPSAQQTQLTLLRHQSPQQGQDRPAQAGRPHQ